MAPVQMLPFIRAQRHTIPSLFNSFKLKSVRAPDRSNNRLLLPMSTAAVASSSPSQTPRPSASLVIVNEKNEVLLVHRNPQARNFAGVHVFPGGNFDKKQDASLAITAIRETFEESGLLLASSSGSEKEVSDEILDEARRSIHEQHTLFATFLEEHGLKPDIGSLLPFTQWITPVGVPRRFHTQFYVTFLRATPSSGFTSGAKQERIPKPDGGQEVISARFLHPDDALAEFHSKKITFMPPQAYILKTLSGLLQGSVNTLEQRARVEELSAGMFGRMVINPQRLPTKDAGGATILTYEGDETRGGSKGRLHRVSAKMGKTGIPSELELQRNFDIFTEIEPQAFATSSKL